MRSVEACEERPGELLGALNRVLGRAATRPTRLRGLPVVDMVAHQAFVLVLGSTPVRLGLSSGWNLSPTEYLQSKIQNFVTRRSA